MAVVVSVYGKADLGQIERAEKQLAGMKTTVQGQVGPWSRFGSVVSSTGAKIAAGLAAAGIVRWLGQSVKAAEEAEVTTAKLNRAVTASGTPWITYAGHMKEVVDAQSQLSAYSGGTLKGALATLTQGTGNASKALQLLAVTTDLARGKNIDLNTAAKIVGKVAMGNVTALTRYGIVVKKGTSATAALAMLQARFAGQASAYGATSAGAQEKFNNALKKLQVTIGTVLLPIVTSFTGKITGLLQKFQALPAPVQKFIVAVAAIGAAVAIIAPFVSSIIGVMQAMKIAAGIAKLWAAAQWLLNAAMSANPLVLIGLAIVALVAAFIILWKKCDWFRNFWIGLWEQVKGVAQAVWPVIKAVGEKIVAALQWAWDAVAAAVKWFWGWAGPFITTYVTAWWAVIKANAEAIATIIKWLWDNVGAAVRWFWGWAGPYIKTAIDLWHQNISTVIHLIVAVVKTAWDAISTAVRFAVDSVIATIHTIGAVVAFLQGVWDRVKDGASSAVHAVTGFFGNIGGKIKDAVGNAGKLLYDVGEAIVQGLVSGIVNAWHWVTDKLHSLISGLSSAAKKLLGISSPSKVFAGIGLSAGMGLAAGMDASRNLVANASARLTSASLPGYGGGGVLAVGAGGSSHNITIQVSVEVNAPNAGSPAEVRAAVRAGVDPALAQLAREIQAI